MEHQVKQDKSETCNYSLSNLATTRVNEYPKIKAHELVRSLKFIFLGIDFSDHLDQWSTVCRSTQIDPKM